MAGDERNEFFVFVGCDDNYEQTHEPTKRDSITESSGQAIQADCE
jgi:hypothetical protein